MNRGVRSNKKEDHKLAKSRSKSPGNSKVITQPNQKLQKSGSKVNNAKNNNKLNRSRSKSPQRSIDPKKGNQKANNKK
jgi:hypothetical protein